MQLSEHRLPYSTLSAQYVAGPAEARDTSVTIWLGPQLHALRLAQQALGDLQTIERCTLSKLVAHHPEV